MGKVHDIVIEDVISRMEADGNLVWQRPWNSVGLMPMNLKSGNQYRGSNVLLLSFSQYKSPYWVTAKQARAFGGTPKTTTTTRLRGPFLPLAGVEVEVPCEKQEPRLIIFFKQADKDDPDSYRFMRFYKVYNTDQFDGIEHSRLDELENMKADERLRVDGDAEAVAESLLAAYSKRGAEVEHGGNQACYIPTLDKIHMPERGQFEKVHLYYKTLFHEHAHDTGHHKRLERDGVVNHIRFGSHDYSVEELIADTTAAMLCHHTGMYTNDVAHETAAYLQDWIKKLRAEPQMLFTAGAAAQRAFDFITTGKRPKKKKD